MMEMEDVLGVGDDAESSQNGAELTDFVEEHRGVPMLAVELVVLHERKHQMGQAEHLVEGGSVGLVDQKIAVFRDDPLCSAWSLAVGRSISMPFLICST